MAKGETWITAARSGQLSGTGTSDVPFGPLCYLFTVCPRMWWENMAGLSQTSSIKLGPIRHHRPIEIKIGFLLFLALKMALDADRA